MQSALRPMNLGEILDRTFAIYRKKFLLFGGIAALPAAVMLAIHIVDIGWVHTDRLIGGAGVTQRGQVALSWLLAYGYYHISGFVTLLFLPAFVRIASCEVFGENATIVASFRFALARWRRYLWLAFLKYFAVLILPEALTFGVFFGIGTLEDKLGLLGDSPNIPAIIILLLPIPAGITLLLWAGACFSLVFPAAVLEEMSAWKALRRSWILTEGSRGRIFAAWLMVFACALVLEGLAAFLIWWIATLIYAGPHYSSFNRQVYAVVAHSFYAVIGALVGPLYPIAITLFYYDQRSRKEGFDVEIMMEAAGLATPESGPVRLLHGSSADFEGTAEPLWPQIVKFIRSLRGFD
jgi:hypothetical protein